MPGLRAGVSISVQFKFLPAAAAEAVPVSLDALPPLAALEELRIDARVVLGPDVEAVLRCQVRVG